MIWRHAWRAPGSGSFPTPDQLQVSGYMLPAVPVAMTARIRRVFEPCRPGAAHTLWGSKLGQVV
jgi:hypothetical protein